MKKIIVVTVNWLGDAIMTTPVFKALRQQYPQAYIAVMAVERVTGIFTTNPYINEVIVFDEKGQHRGLLAKLKFISQLAFKKFDTAFFIHRSFTRIFILFLAGVKNRIGYQRKKTSFLLVKKIALPTTPMHRKDYYLNLFEKAGIVINDRNPQIFVTEENFKGKAVIVDFILKKNKVIIGINPTANWDLKRWPAANFAKLVDELTNDDKYYCIFIGADKERVYIDSLTKSIKSKHWANWAGLTDLEGLAGLMKYMTLFISNDSGPAHYSAALDIPTLALFGPTDPKLTGPQGKYVEIICHNNRSCQIPCYNLECKTNYCMQDISVEEVVSKVKEMLKKYEKYSC